MDIAAQHGAGRVVLGDQRIAIVEEPRRARAAPHLVEPAQRIVAQRRAAARHQAVLDILAVPL